jgi:RimJ/RimL family protein N-acetyltransferase
MNADRVTLRNVRDEDLAVLDRFLTEPEARGPFEWHGWSDPTRWRRRWADNGLLGDDQGMLMVVRGEKALGFVAWHKQVTSQVSFCWCMGINLLPEARGHGYGTEAQQALVDYLFRHSQAERIQADTEADNIAEQRALEKAGFTREGVLRSVAWRDGRWRDGVMYSVIRSEWAAER